jgi:hypothetical protein
MMIMSGYLLLFAAVGGLGTFLNAAGSGSTPLAIVAAVATVLCLGLSVVLFKISAHRGGGIVGPKPAPAKVLTYHTRIRRRARR